jgi:hypothetical protein
MLINKVYPHVNVTTTALLRNPVDFLETGATSLFVPFIAKKGLSDKIQKVFNLTQFISEYGEPDFVYQGRTVLNIYNWLNAGGSIYALRLVGEEGANSKAVVTFTEGEAEVEYVTFTAKSKGTYYDQLKLEVSDSIYTTASTKYLDVEVLLNGRRVQTIFKVSASNFVNVLTSSQWINSVTFAEGKTFASFYEKAKLGLTVEFSGGSNGSEDLDRLTRSFFYGFETTVTIGSASVAIGDIGENFSLELPDIRGLEVGDSLSFSAILEEGSEPVSFIAKITVLQGTGEPVAQVTTFEIISNDSEISNLSEDSEWTIKQADSSIEARTTLANKLEYPVDLILDAGLKLSTKQAILDFTEQESDTALRPDIVAIFDQYDFSSSEKGTKVSVSSNSFNHAVYTQRITVSDVISGRDIWVTPSYFLATLIPTNDRIYGVQWPTAGLTRGVLVGNKGLDVNPTEIEKQDFYKFKVNYIEKDSRGSYFMSQLTQESRDTALKFLNNARSTIKITRELENIGREYLFDFNDSTTLSNMRNALNRYLNEWIQNRTLSLGTVEVVKNEFSDERVDVTMNIRFTGTIEIISIDITIE